MKNVKLILLLVTLTFIIISCSENDSLVIEPIEAKTISNLHAPQLGGQGQPTSGEFTKFSFKEGKQVVGDNWDIAFRGLRIIVNGGSKYGLTDEPEKTGNASLAIVKNVFKDVKEAPVNGDFKQDASGVYAIKSNRGDDWYTYDRATHKVSANGGFIVVVKTIDGNYAKMEIKNYYKDLDATNPANGRYYTFDYVYNPNVGDKSFQ